MKAGSMEGLIGASQNIKLVSTPMRVYKEAERRGDTGTMERAMGYVTDFQEKAHEYSDKAQEELAKELKEERKEQEVKREKAIEKRKEETKEYWKNREYFEKILPVPPYYAKGNPDKAVTWFKDTREGNKIYNQMSFYREMAKKYNVDLYRSECDFVPGEIVYEDEFQIAVKNCVTEEITREKI